MRAFMSRTILIYATLTVLFAAIDLFYLSLFGVKIFKATLGDVLAPAIGYARNGFPLVPRISQAILAVESLFRDEWHSSADTWLPDGKVPRPGALHTLPYSQIKAVKNLSRDYAFAVFNISIAYQSDFDRALEIIRELEPVKRNVYSGAVGYVGWNGDADTAIAIRTAVIQDGRLHVQAGAGIVFDSEPEKEWEETMNKGRALFRAVAQAAKGL